MSTTSLEKLQDGLEEEFKTVSDIYMGIENALSNPTGTLRIKKEAEHLGNELLSTMADYQNALEYFLQAMGRYV